MDSAARSFARIVAGVAWILVATSGIVSGLLLWLGPPTATREYRVRSEIARFVPTAGHGLVQLGGETFLLILVAYIARRWLRVRL